MVVGEEAAALVMAEEAGGGGGGAAAGERGRVGSEPEADLRREGGVVARVPLAADAAVLAPRLGHLRDRG
jgi:hypothetical protein